MAQPRKKLRERDDFFLAVVAGRNVDIKTLIPPTATTAREELLLEIADRISNNSVDIDTVVERVLEAMPEYDGEVI